MAWSSAELSATELALRAADKPALIVNNTPTQPASLYWSTDGAAGGTDRTDADKPTRLVYDHTGGFESSADSTSSTDWYLVWELGAGTTFDSMMVLGHNWGTLGLTGTLSIADDDTFATNKQDLATFSPADDTRIIEPALYHTGSTARRYSSVLYVRIHLTRGAAFTPTCNEVVLGRAYQLKHHPERPFDNKRRREDSAVTVTKSGIRHKYVFNKGRFQLEASLRVSEDAYISDLESWFDGARDSFVWWPKPNSEPDNWYLMQRGDDFDFPLVDYIERRVTITADEQGPESKYLSQES